MFGTEAKAKDSLDSIRRRLGPGIFQSRLEHLPERPLRNRVAQHEGPVEICKHSGRIAQGKQASGAGGRRREVGGGRWGAGGEIER